MPRISENHAGKQNKLRDIILFNKKGGGWYVTIFCLRQVGAVAIIV